MGITRQHNFRHRNKAYIDVCYSYVINIYTQNGNEEKNSGLMLVLL